MPSKSLLHPAVKLGLAFQSLLYRHRISHKPHTRLLCPIPGSRLCIPSSNTVVNLFVTFCPSHSSAALPKPCKSLYQSILQISTISCPPLLSGSSIHFRTQRHLIHASTSFIHQHTSQNSSRTQAPCSTSGKERSSPPPFTPSHRDSSPHGSFNSSIDPQGTIEQSLNRVSAE